MEGTSTEMCTADQMFLEWMEDATVHVQLTYFNSNTPIVKSHYNKVMLYLVQKTPGVVSVQCLF